MCVQGQQDKCIGEGEEREVLNTVQEQRKWRTF